MWGNELPRMLYGRVARLKIILGRVAKNAMLFDYWYMFFACVFIATLAMSAGIGGATFFVPFLLLVLKVPVQSAVPIGIFVEVFGFAAGVYNYARRKQIDYRLAQKTVLIALPFVILGVIFGHSIKQTLVEYLFILALMIFATQLLVGREDRAEGKEASFGFSNGIVAAIGGLLLGFLSTGMGESNEYNFFSRLGKSPVVTAGTSVLVVASTALAATFTQIIFLLHQAQWSSMKPFVTLIAYSVLGAIVGAALGVRVANRVDRHQFRKLVGVALFFVALTSLAKIFY